MVCSFVPRKFDYHPLAIPAPYNHSNINSDEVIYYDDRTTPFNSNRVAFSRSAR